MNIALLRNERKESRGRISMILKHLKKNNLIEFKLYCAEVYKMLLSKTLTNNFISFLTTFVEQVHKRIGGENRLKYPPSPVAAIVKTVNQKLSQNTRNVKNAESSEKVSCASSSCPTGNEIVKRGILKILVRLLENENKMNFENVLSLLKRAIGKSAYEHLRFMLAKSKPFEITFCLEAQIPLKRKMRSTHG